MKYSILNALYPCYFAINLNDVFKINSSFECGKFFISYTNNCHRDICEIEKTDDTMVHGDSFRINASTELKELKHQHYQF